MVVVFLFPETPEVGVGDMNYTVVVLGRVLILSLVRNHFPKHGGQIWFTGPVPTIDVREGSPGVCGDKGKENVTVEVPYYEPSSSEHVVPRTCLPSV